MPALEDVPPAMLKRYLQKLFAVADVNGDGVLQPAEFKRLLELSGFNFPPATVRKLLNAADVNKDGVIEYDEFVPVALEILKAQKGAAAPAPKKAAPAPKKAAAAAAANMPALEDVPPAMLKRYLQKLFAVADVNGDGVLQPAEFKRLLELSGFNFPPATVRKLLNAADVNKDGVIEYDEFVPVALEILKAQAGTAARASAPAKPASAPARAAQPRVNVGKDNSDVASLEGRVLAVQSRRIIRSKIKDLFARLDSDRDGRLSVAELASAFGDAMARRIQATLDRNSDGRVTQYEMRRFFDDECSKAVESGVPEYKYLEGIVEMLESAF